MLVYIIFGLIFRTALADDDLPPYFPRCNIDDPDINGCIIKASQTLKPNLIEGVPELGIPPIDPLSIPKITMQQGTDAINYKVTLTNTTIYGFKNYNFTEFNYDPKLLEFHATANYNSMSFTSNYDLEGKILAVSIRGQGTCKANLGPSTGTLDTIGELVKRNGEEYYHLLSNKATIVISDYNVTFDNLFGGNQELARTVEKVLADNSKLLLDEVLPAIENVAANLAEKILSGVQNVPYKKLFPPSH